MPPIGKEDAKEIVQKLIAEHELIIFTTSTCPFCKKAKALFDALDIKYENVVLNERGKFNCNFSPFQLIELGRPQEQ